MLFKMTSRLEKAKVALFSGLVAFIATRAILFSPGTIGHRLDWSVPYSAYALSKLLLYPLYIWDKQFLGYDMMTEQNLAPAYAGYGVLGKLGLSGAFVSKATLFAIVFAAGFAMYFLAKSIIGDDKEPPGRLCRPALASAFFYAVSPSLFSQIVGGAQYFIQAYAVAPAVLYFYIKSIKKDAVDWHSVITAIFFYYLAGMQIQFIFFLSLLLISYWVVMDRRRVGLYSLGAILVGVALLNMSWLPNFIMYRSWNVAALVGTIPEAALKSTMVDHGIPMTQALANAGHWDPVFKYSIRPLLRSPWVIATTLINIGIFSLLLVRRDKRDYLFLAIALIGVAMAKGGTPPLGVVNLWLYTHVVFLRLFRSMHHALFLVAFGYSIALGLLMSHLRHSLAPNTYARLGVAMAAGLVLYVHPGLSGDMSGLVETFVQPKQVDKLDALARRPDNTSRRVLYLPTAGSPNYESGKGRLSGGRLSGNDPMVRYSVIPSFATDVAPSLYSKYFANAEREFYDGQIRNITQFTRTLAVRYVVLRPGVRHAHIPGMEAFDFKETKKALDSDPRLTAVQKSSKLPIYELRDPLPKIYASTKPTLVGLRNDSLSLLDESSHLDNKPALFYSEINPNPLPDAGVLSNRSDSAEVLLADSNIADLALDQQPKEFTHFPSGVDSKRAVARMPSTSRFRLKIPRRERYGVWIKKDNLQDLATPEIITRADLTFTGKGKRVVRRLRLRELFDHNPVRWYRWTELTLERGDYQVTLSQPGVLKGGEGIAVVPEPRLRRSRNRIVKYLKAEGELSYIYSDRYPGRQRTLVDALAPQRIYRADDLARFSTDGTLVDDPQGASGRSLMNGSVAGPYEVYGQGGYTATFRLKSAGARPGAPVAVVDVVTGGAVKTLAQLRLYATDLPQNNSYGEIQLPFNVSAADAGQMEFRVHFLGNGDLSVNAIRVGRHLVAAAKKTERVFSNLERPTSNVLRDRLRVFKTTEYDVTLKVSPNSRNATRTYWADRPEGPRSGHLVRDSLVRGHRVLLNGSTAGPYEAYPPGEYRASFFLRSRNPKTSTNPVAVIDVTTGGAAQIITSRILYQSDFQKTARFREFALPFHLKGPSSRTLEFRVHYLGNSSLRLSKTIVSSTDRPLAFGPHSSLQVGTKRFALSQYKPSSNNDLGRLSLAPGGYPLVLDPDSDVSRYRLQLRAVGAVAPAPAIKFAEKAPTSYMSTVKGASAPFMLVFSESFHPGWQAYILPKQGRIWPWTLWTAKPLPADSHVALNGFANGWWVSKTGDYRIAVFYRPQLLYAAGLLFSLALMIVMARQWVTTIDHEPRT